MVKRVLLHCGTRYFFPSVRERWEGAVALLSIPHASSFGRGQKGLGAQCLSLGVASPWPLPRHGEVGRVQWKRAFSFQEFPVQSSSSESP